MLLNKQGYNGGIHFKVMFAEFINLLEQNQFKWWKSKVGDVFELNLYIFKRGI